MTARWTVLCGFILKRISFPSGYGSGTDIRRQALIDSKTILRDSFAGYGKLECEVACCWAHVRRYLLEACNNGCFKVEPLLNIIRSLYKIENDAKVCTEQKGTDTALFQDRKTARRTSVKLVDEFFALAKALQNVLPKLSTTPDNQIDSLLPPFWKPESK